MASMIDCVSKVLETSVRNISSKWLIEDGRKFFRRPRMDTDKHRSYGLRGM